MVLTRSLSGTMPSVDWHHFRTWRHVTIPHLTLVLVQVGPVLVKLAQVLLLVVWLVVLVLAVVVLLLMLRHLVGVGMPSIVVVVVVVVDIVLLLLMPLLLLLLLLLLAMLISPGLSPRNFGVENKATCIHHA